MPKNLVPKITLSADERDRLVTRLNEMITQAEKFRTDSDWGDLHELYWRLYLAEPETSVRSWPWENASNLFIPLTKVACDAVVAQEFDAMLSNNPSVVGMEASDYQMAEDLSQYYFEYFFKDVCPLSTWGTDWLLDNTIDGTAAVKVRQNRDNIVRRVESVESVPSSYDALRVDELTGETVKYQVPTEEYRRVERAFIERVDQTEIEVTDLETIYVAPDSGPSLQYPHCRWYYQVQHLTWDDLVERRRHGYDNIDDDLKGFLGDRDISQKEATIRAREGTSETAVEPTIEVLEFYMRWPLPARYTKTERDDLGVETEVEEEQDEGDEDGIPEEIVVTYCTANGKILLIRPLSRVSPDGKRPHTLSHYHRIPRYFYGIGIPSKMRHLNAAINAIRNQSIDWGTLSVMPWGFYAPSITGLLPELNQIQPGQLIPTMDPRGVNFPRLQGDPNFFTQQEQVIQAWAEKVSNISDYNLGRAPQTPNAPRTRGGQAMMLQQANIGFSILVSVHAQAFLDVFRRVHAYHKKYARPGDLYRVLNRQTGALQQKSVRAGMFDADVDFSFVLNPNRYLQQQQKQMLFTITMQAMVQAMQMPMLAQSIRTALGDLYDAHQMKNFDLVWPPEMLAMQQQMMMQPPGMPGQPPMPGGPPMGPPQGPPPQSLADQFGYNAAPETAEEEEKVNVS